MSTPTLRRIRELSESIASAKRCTAEVEQVAGYAPCINDSAATEIIAESCRRTLGAANVIFTDVPAVTSENCGEYMSRVSEVFFWLGAADTIDAAPLHSPYFHLNTEALPFGVNVHVSDALSLLANLTAKAADRSVHHDRQNPKKAA